MVKSKPSNDSGLWVKENNETIQIGNDLIGIQIRKKLKNGEGPIEKIKLRSGLWTGGSKFDAGGEMEAYSAKVVQKGAVFVEVQCEAKFKDGGQWSASFCLQSREPIVVVEEKFDAPGGGTFTLQLGDRNFQPKDVFFRGGAGGMLAKIGTESIGTGTAYVMEPWLHWWGAERQGNWFALYTNTNKEILDPTKGLGKNQSSRLLTSRRNWKIKRKPSKVLRFLTC